MILTIYCVITIIMFIWLGLAGIALKTDDEGGFCECLRNNFGENGVNIGLTIVVTLCSVLWPLSLAIILLMHFNKH